MNRSPIETSISDEIVDLHVLRGRTVNDYAAHYDRAGAQLSWAEKGGISPEGALFALIHNEKNGVGRVDIYPSVEIDRYRTDLLICYGPIWIVVECDGHEWHERTRQQASSDRARDRALLRAGVGAVLRFTGSDIHHDARQCAQEVIDTHNAILRRVRSVSRRISVSSSDALCEEHY